MLYLIQCCPTIEKHSVCPVVLMKIWLAQLLTTHRYNNTIQSNKFSSVKIHQDVKVFVHFTSICLDFYLSDRFEASFGILFPNRVSYLIRIAMDLNAVALFYQINIFGKKKPPKTLYSVKNAYKLLHNGVLPLYRQYNIFTFPFQLPPACFYNSNLLFFWCFNQ